jgi:hypothetical protein
MKFTESVYKVIDELCASFDSSKDDFCDISVDQCREEFLSLFTRFSNDPVLYFAVDPGWFPLVFELNRKLSKLDPAYTIFQIKEKFAGLRFYAYFSNIPPIVESICFDLISFAELKSNTICEICGLRGEAVKKDGYFLTRCKKH